MQVIPAEIPEIKEIRPVRHYDARGFFSEIFREAVLRENGIAVSFVQENHHPRTAFPDPADEPDQTRARRRRIDFRCCGGHSQGVAHLRPVRYFYCGERPVLRVVADQTGSPTSAADLAGAIARITRCVPDGNAAWGICHFAGAGAVTWHGFAEAIFELAACWRGPPPRVEAIATVDYPTPARRPANSILDCSRIAAAFAIEPRPWRAALAEMIEELGQRA